VNPDEIRSSYEVVAEKYATTFFDELTRKPFDRELLDAFAALAPHSKALDVGCGPGHIGRYLSEQGMDVVGVDLSPAMIEIARRLNPAMRFEVGDMRSLPAEDGTVDAVVAFYSLIHIPREEVSYVLTEFRRVLAPDGRLLLAMHGGTGTVARSEFMGEQVPFAATLFQRDELAELIRVSGFQLTLSTVRPPYQFEYQTPRLYLGATRSDV
jgi:ubiquinone/menaquinone biosynthesis C-methylase UbiE